MIMTLYLIDTAHFHSLLLLKSFYTTCYLAITTCYLDITSTVTADCYCVILHNTTNSGFISTCSSIAMGSLVSLLVTQVGNG